MRPDPVRVLINVGVVTTRHGSGQLWRQRLRMSFASIPLRTILEFTIGCGLDWRLEAAQNYGVMASCRPKSRSGRTPSNQQQAVLLLEGEGSSKTDDYSFDLVERRVCCRSGLDEAGRRSLKVAM